jgi:hypothetical protein
MIFKHLRRHLEELLAVRGRAGRFMDEPAVPNIASERADLREKCGTQIEQAWSRRGLRPGGVTNSRAALPGSP